MHSSLRAVKLSCQPSAGYAGACSDSLPIPLCMQDDVPRPTPLMAWARWAGTSTSSSVGRRGKPARQGELPRRGDLPR